MDLFPRVREIKTKINKWELIKGTSFFIAKEAINKMKRYLWNGRRRLEMMWQIRHSSPAHSAQMQKAQTTESKVGQKM